MNQTDKKVKKRPGKRLHSAVAQHAAEKAAEIRSKYGPRIDYPALLRILEDRRYVRYPVEIRLVSEGIDRGLFARTEQKSDNPEEGYLISVHEHFRDRPDLLPALVLYQTVLVNYGDLATAADAEIFGAGVLGMERDAYYELIVGLTDALWSSAGD